MASRRQSPRLSRQALTDTTQARLSLHRSLISKYSNDATEIKSESVPAELPKAIKNPRAKGRSVKRQGNKPASPPDNWKLVFDAIKEYRKSTLAPVDTMGCERLSERHVDDKTSRYQTLTSLMLSSQTKDAITAAAMRNLQERIPGGLSVDNVISCDKDLIHECIKSVGFHTRKTYYIKDTATILKEKFDGDIPDTIEGLTSLPGVGPKMGYLALQCAWNKNAGIGVDVHVHRIANRLGWVKTANGTPEDTREGLEAWLPKEHWKEINPLFVGFGQVTCLPRGPRCHECPVNDLCPSAKVPLAVKKQRLSVAIEEKVNGDVSTAKKIVKKECVVDALNW